MFSGDGRYVSFASWATNLFPGDINGERDIIVRAAPHLTISSVTPTMLPAGATTNVVLRGSDFFNDTRVSVDDATVSNIVVLNETTISADVTVPSNRTSGTRDVTISLLGTGTEPMTGSSGVCAACVTFF